MNTKLLIIKLKNLPSYSYGLMRGLYFFATFFLLLLIFLASKIGLFISHLPLIRRINFPKNFAKLDLVISKLEAAGHSEVKRQYLISLAYKNLLVKKTRSFVTIFGMSVGIGIIVLLISLGYGIEKLIINKVAGLDELKMVDVTTGGNTALHMNRKTIDEISKIQYVDKSLPVISLVGRVSYNKASTDVLVFASSSEYLKLLKVKLLGGSFYNDNGDYFSYTSAGEVAGAQTQMPRGTFDTPFNTSNVKFNLVPDTDIPVWSEPSLSSQKIGYVTRLPGGFSGVEYWGEDYLPYDENGRSGYDYFSDKYLGSWIKTNIAVSHLGSDNKFYPLLDSKGRQSMETGYIQSKMIQISDRFSIQGVLGEATQSASLTNPFASDSADLALDSYVVSTSSSGIEFVTLQSSDSSSVKKSLQNIDFPQPSGAKAVISSGLLRLLNIPQNKAIGTKFKVSFVVSKNLVSEVEGKAQTSDVEYEISGIFDDPDIQYFYIPLSNLKSLHVDNASQVKLILNDKDNLSKVRKTIETMGFRTASTADTVSQIESLFANLRVLLGLLGTVALIVASLGMFNTLTVSLLERTREIGGMKTMGMISKDIEDLFMAEAMIMGLSGGIGGLLLGFLIGETISIIVSIFAIAKGQGFLNLTYVPPTFIIFILVSSFLVGTLTGLYPAIRAKKISALNALRYE